MHDNADGEVNDHQGIEDLVPATGMHHPLPDEPAGHAGVGHRHGEDRVEQRREDLFMEQDTPNDDTGRVQEDAGQDKASISNYCNTISSGII